MDVAFFIFDFYLSNSSSPSLYDAFPSKKIIIFPAQDCREKRDRWYIEDCWEFITSQSIRNERNHKKILFQHKIDKKISFKQYIRTEHWEGGDRNGKLLNDFNTLFFLSKPWVCSTNPIKPYNRCKIRFRFLFRILYKI